MRKKLVRSLPVQAAAPLPIVKFRTALACLLVCVGTVSLCVESRSQSLIGDRKALVALYNATDGPNWKNNANWLSDEPLNSWHGVSVRNGRVTRLNLSENQLTGSIPAELGNLDQLGRLYLYSNQLAGSIPAELGNLGRLNTLYLFDNQLTGSIPAELSNLDYLEALGLSHNQLTGSIPVELGKLPILDFLNLSHNQLSGPIPAELGNLDNLNELYLSHNQLTGSVPVELGNLRDLDYLYLDNNQLTGSVPVELGNFRDLEFLNLSHNQLTGPIPAELGNIRDLDFLNLSHNQLSGPIPAELGNLHSLYFREMNLSHNQLSGSIPAELGNIKRLETLDLSHNQLTGPVPAELGNIRGHWTNENYIKFDLSHNQLSGSIPAELGNISRLHYLDLSHNQLSGPIPVELCALRGLEALYLTGNQLAGLIPRCFTELSLLRFHSYENPGLSEPDDAAYRELLAGIEDYRGPGYVAPPTLFVPVVLSSAGRNEAFFTSELTLTNRGSESAMLHYTYTALAGGGSGTAADRLDAGQQKIESDAIAYLRGLGLPIPGSGNRIGTLAVDVSGSSGLRVMVRTTTAVPGGRAGLAYPGIPGEAGFTYRAVYLCGLRQNSQDRSNVALQNMGAREAGPITLRTTVYSGDGADSSPRVLREVTLRPGGFHQFSGVLGDIANGYVKVERVSGRAPFYAYGVIND